MRLNEEQIELLRFLQYNFPLGCARSERAVKCLSGFMHKFKLNYKLKVLFINTLLFKSLFKKKKEMYTSIQ